MGAYYTLVTSLPLMPHFERAERIPLTRLRLEQRLRMLEPESGRATRTGGAAVRLGAPPAHGAHRPRVCGAVPQRPSRCRCTPRCARYWSFGWTSSR